MAARQLYHHHQTCLLIALCGWIIYLATQTHHRCKGYLSEEFEIVLLFKFFQSSHVANLTELGIRWAQWLQSCGCMAMVDIACYNLFPCGQPARVDTECSYQFSNDMMYFVMSSTPRNILTYVIYNWKWTPWSGALVFTGHKASNCSSLLNFVLGDIVINSQHTEVKNNWFETNLSGSWVRCIPQVLYCLLELTLNSFAENSHK